MYQFVSLPDLGSLAILPATPKPTPTSTTISVSPDTSGLLSLSLYHSFLLLSLSQTTPLSPLFSLFILLIWALHGNDIMCTVTFVVLIGTEHGREKGMDASAQCAGIHQRAPSCDGVVFPLEGNCLAWAWVDQKLFTNYSKLLWCFSSELSKFFRTGIVILFVKIEKLSHRQD